MPKENGLRPRTVPMDAPADLPGILFLARPGSSSRMLVDYLNQKGFAIWSAEQDIAAFDLFVRHGIEIEWLLIEHDFLDCAGERFVQRFHLHFPGVRACLVTADPFGATARKLSQRGVVVVPKPVSLRKFVHTLATRGHPPATQLIESAVGWASESALERHSWSGN